MKLFSISLLVLAGCASASHAETYVDNVRALEKAVRMTESGGVIRVAPGRYDLTDLKIPRDMTIIGENGVYFYSSEPVAKGILNPLWVSSFRVENITFEGAESPDLNGAGIRHDGEDLTIVNCVFRDNENGVLATGQEHGRIEITDTAFIGNGYGDGYSHGIYVSSGGALTITGSDFIGTKIGHHVKSLAGETTITKSFFDDADGETSYAVDTSGGGAVTITDNRFIQAENGDNPHLFNYDLSRGGDALSLTIKNNTIINRNPYGRLLRNESSLTPAISDNEITNEGRGKLEY